MARVDRQLFQMRVIVDDLDAGEAHWWLAGHQDTACAGKLVHPGCGR